MREPQRHHRSSPNRTARHLKRNKHPVCFESHCISHAGPVELVNEDYALADPSAGIFAVADGMGGRPGGDQASRTAVETFARRIRALPARARVKKASLEKAVNLTNRAVRRLGASDPLLAGGGTTLSAVVFNGRDGRVVHVGDSRIYVYHADRLRRVTRDHTLAEEMRSQDHQASADTPKSSWSNVLSRSVGTRPSVKPDIKSLRLSCEDLLVFVTDGVMGSVTEAQIAEMLADGRYSRPDVICQAIMTKALSSQPRDNLTVMVVKLRKLGGTV